MLTNFNRNTQVIIQGITGKEGQRVADFMLKSGVNVVAGVRPGKAGEMVLGVPVFNSVKDVRQKFPQALSSCVYVPPQLVLAAATEALEAGVTFLHVIGEGVPVLDTAKLIALCQQHSAQLLGPASLGLIIPGVFKLGSIGGEDNSSYIAGSVGLISRSGGMSSEMANILTQAGIGQSMVVHVGGDYLIGTTMLDVALTLQADTKTKVIALIGEVGGSYELAVVEAVRQGKVTKPLVVFMAGQFVETLPKGVPLGHAGAIIGSERETRAGKMKAFREVKATVVETPGEMIEVVREKLE